MTIPSPRKLFEIAAFCFFAVCVALGTVIAAFLLLVIWAIEASYDGVKSLRMRGRA